MKKIFKILIFISFILLFTSFSKCSFFPDDEKPKEIIIMSYNVCNLFDDVKNGTEYPEFDPSHGIWTSSLYRERLKNITEVISAAEPKNGPDIICIQEVENKKVIKDLATVWLKQFAYSDFICADNDGSAITTGVISRYPVKKIKNHAIHLEDFDNLRAVTELLFYIDDKEFYIFNCHLKSKLGGDENTETARLGATAAISKRCKEIYRENPDAKIIIAGDLNENIDEYEKHNKKYLTALMPLKEIEISAAKDALIVTGDKQEVVFSENSLVFYSPWFEKHGTGSYYYKNSWETIDHFLLAAPFFNNKDFEYSKFKVLNNGEFANSNGAPLGWNSRTATGYSDHFPIVLFISNN